MQRYVRLAGIEVEGATDGLNILPQQKGSASVIEFTKRGAASFDRIRKISQRRGGYQKNACSNLSFAIRSAY